MDTPTQNAEKPFDPTLRRIARFLDKAVIALLVVLAPIALARLPHYLEAGFFVMGCALLSLLFTLAVRLAQKLGYAGPDALDPPSKTEAFEDVSAQNPTKSVPIREPATANPTVQRGVADESAARHTVVLPGGRRIVYWSDERQL